MPSARSTTSFELLSDDDDIIELPQAPKRARSGHSTSSSQKRLKAEKPKRQPVSIVISDSDDNTIEMVGSPSVPRPQTEDREAYEVGSGYLDHKPGLTRQKIQHDDDSDSDYDTLHAGLDINDPSNVSLLY